MFLIECFNELIVPKGSLNMLCISDSFYLLLEYSSY